MICDSLNAATPQMLSLRIATLGFAGDRLLGFCRGRHAPWPSYADLRERSFRDRTSGMTLDTMG